MYIERTSFFEEWLKLSIACDHFLKVRETTKNGTQKGHLQCVLLFGCLRWLGRGLEGRQWGLRGLLPYLQTRIDKATIACSLSQREIEVPAMHCYKPETGLTTNIDGFVPGYELIQSVSSFPPKDSVVLLYFLPPQIEISKMRVRPSVSLLLLSFAYLELSFGGYDEIVSDKVTTRGYDLVNLEQQRHQRFVMAEVVLV